MTSSTWVQIAAAISEAIGTAFEAERVQPIGGGCINDAVRVSDRYRSFFVKTNELSSMGMFEAERDGLRDLGAARAVRVPAPVTDGAADGVAFLVLECLSMTRLSGDGWSRLGEQLASLHRTSASQFGWRRANTIGSTPQPNDWTTSWVDFWREHRLGFQLELAARNGLSGSTVKEGERLLEHQKALFGGCEPQPSLLHGDLWSGNVAADEKGAPVLFDPAVYYGDRETDLAMSEMFGRFDQRFYDAYQSAWPLAPGYELRKTLYNLYHVLNHFNLFGGGYAGQVRSMINRLVKAL
ncbi:MAG: hypothetical protein MAG794_01672 [Gammaproteobacteria bacterium]|nr:hypothetical protein [Gammaproteobacteria bacterium]